jgi:hypothetical protein
MALKSILSYFRKKPRAGLRSPARTKRLLRWGVRRRSKWTYLAALCWGYAMSLGLAIYTTFLAAAKKPEWLYMLSTGLATIFAAIYLYEAMGRSVKSWSRRHAHKVTG